GRSFEASGLMHKGDLYVRWEAHAFNDRMPPPDNPNAGQKDAAGVARVGLDGGAVALLPADKFPVEAAALPAALREQQSAPYYVGSAPGADRLQKLLVVRDRVAAVHWVEEQKQQVISLKRWERATARELPPAAMIRADAAWVWLSADGEHMLVKADHVKGRPQPEHRAWRAFSLASGEALGQFVPETGAAYQPTVIGGCVYYTEVGPSD